MTTLPSHLCRGFQTTRIDQSAVAIIDTHFALLNDGTVLQSDEHVRSSSEFCSPERTWSKVDALPPHAEFIGNYHVPSL